MAWRGLTEKGIHTGLLRGWTFVSPRPGVQSKFSYFLEDAVKPLCPASLRCISDKTIDIFEGMTIVKLAKRTGESISTMKDILVNVEEKVESEFDPLSVDISELVAMVFVNIVHVGVGPISKSDVELAKACGACIVGFNVKSPRNAISLVVTQASIKIVLHRVIYHLLEEIGSLIVGKAPGTYESQVSGEAEVLRRRSTKGDDVKIAGCRVIDGFVSKSSP